MSLLEPRTSLDMIPDFVVIYDVPWDEFKEFEKTSGDFSSEEDQESDRCLSTVKAEEKELDARAVQALADQAVVMDCPSRHAAVGPGTGVPGPRRYIGVLRPVLLFSMMRQWVHEHSLGNAPSWATFRRALKKARVYLSFRKSSGQHATCDHCKWHKARLRSKLSVNERKQEMEKYCHHLLEVWRDRQSDASWVALSVLTSLSVQASLGNARFEYNGVWMLRTDGLDQAKHRMPRILQPQKAVERLPRPVCPVNMCWAHGHCCDHCKWPLVERFSSCSASWLEVLLPVGSKTLSPGRKTGRRPCNQVTRLD